MQQSPDEFGRARAEIESSRVLARLRRAKLVEPRMYSHKPLAGKLAAGAAREVQSLSQDAPPRGSCAEMRPLR
eukprot:scaffold3440_cov135-Isochrysis_galbana.AAC.6